MEAPGIPRPLLAPRYWPTWLGLGVLRLLCLLPLPAMLAVGRGLGSLVGLLARRRRQVVLTNLRLCLPDLTENERIKLADEHFKSLGAGVFEAGLAWWASDERLARILDVSGLEHLDSALAKGGVLLLTGHFTTLELAARMAAMQRPFHPMYRPLNNALADHLTSRWRSQRARVPAIPKDDLRALVRALRDGRAIWYAPDQTLDRRHGVWSRFFGVPALTITATSRLAQMGRASVVPYFPERCGNRYRLRFHPALDSFPGNDEVADADRINRVIEAGARQALPQYFWIHKRFKVQPPGVPEAYRLP